MGNATYDLVVIGSGPAGQKGAIAAAKLGKKMDVVKHQFRRNEGAVIQGGARFLAPNTIRVTAESGEVSLAAEKFLIACGTRPARSCMIPFDGETIINAGEQVTWLTNFSTCLKGRSINDVCAPVWHAPVSGLLRGYFGDGYFGHLRQ